MSGHVRPAVRSPAASIAYMPGRSGAMLVVAGHGRTPDGSPGQLVKNFLLDIADNTAALLSGG